MLKAVADVMRGLARDTDIVARYGGEEFALVPRQAPLTAAVRLAEKIRMTVAEHPFEIEDDEGKSTVKVTVSIGVAAYQGDRLAFFNAADDALYRAKEGGRDCVVVDESSIDAPAANVPAGVRSDW